VNTGYFQPGHGSNPCHYSRIKLTSAPAANAGANPGHYSVKLTHAPAANVGTNPGHYSDVNPDPIQLNLCAPHPLPTLAISSRVKGHHGYFYNYSPCHATSSSSLFFTLPNQSKWPLHC
jgi:hypothetical protein